jgi:glycosyltransferase involved in cell wall biosynthesis
LKILKQRRIKFRLGVIGQQFAETPPVFTWARDYFAEEIVRWGFQPTREEYIAALSEADVFVSTARHEFFGISVVEAIAAGVYPLLPRRLSYPEIIGDEEPASTGEFFYDSSVEELADRLIDLTERRTRDDLRGDCPQYLAKIAARFLWSNVVPYYDDALEQLMMKS